MAITSSLSNEYLSNLSALLKYDSSSSPPLTQNIRSCAALVCAKDEAAYIHEYIHHHLYFGLEEILILINRTTDKTAKVIEKISAAYPSVSFESIDWIDYLGYGDNIQRMAYAYGIAVLRKRGRSSHVLINDVDEYWFPLDFTTPIQDYLMNLPPFHQVSFCWANQNSKEEAPYSAPFKTTSHCGGKQVKSVAWLWADFLVPHEHRSIINGQSIDLDANGKPFAMKNNSRHVYGGDAGKHAARILHRYQRSINEYLSMLLRPSPFPNLCMELRPSRIEEESLWIRKNREGFKDNPMVQLDIPTKILAEYHASLSAFIKRCSIKDEIEEARSFHKMQSSRLIGFLRSCDFSRMKPSEVHALKKVLKGTHLSSIVK